MNNESAEPDNEEKPDPPAAEFVAELVEGESTEDAENQADQIVDDPTATSENGTDPDLNADSAVAATSASAPAVAYSPSILSPPKPTSYQPPPSPMANLAAKGGSVGAIVLGVLSFAGSFITSYAILNSFIGVALGLWGLRSNHRRMALIGILLCLISAFFCVLDISEWLQKLWPSPDL